MNRNTSRRERIKEQKEVRQAFLYLGLTALFIIVILIWGLPLFGKLAGLLIKTEDTPFAGTSENTVKPTAPRFIDIPEATRSAQVNLSGYSPPGTEVKLYVNNSENKTVVADDSGTFSFSAVSLKEGDNIVYATAVKDKVESEKSSIYTVVVDKTSPEIEISEPTDGANFHGQKMKVLDVQGKVNETGAEVYVNERRAILDSEGNFSVNVGLSDGEQTIVVKAVDKSGNETTKEIKVKWEP